MGKKLALAMAAAVVCGGINAAADVSPVAAEETAAPEQPKVYVMPDDVRCYLLKNERITYCTDKQGQPITGEMRKYREGELIRSYPLQNGILEGTAVSYYIHGGILSEKPYTKGKLNGAVKNYYENGKVSEVLPYINGIQEGVTKIYYENGYLQGQGIYIGGKQNGMTRLYDTAGNLVYELQYSDNRLASGYCLTQKSPQAAPAKHELSAEEISLLNKNEIILELKILPDRCAFSN